MSRKAADPTKTKTAKPKASRIYTVKDTETDKVHLVQAPNAVRAISHISKPRYAVALATQHDLVKHIQSGAVIEIADPSADEAEA